jgi:type IV pilus assembly protein PilB
MEQLEKDSSTLDRCRSGLTAARPSRLRLGDHLLKAGLVTPEQLARAVEEQKGSGRRLGETLLAQEVISEHQLAQLLSVQLGYPLADLEVLSIDPAGMLVLGESLARRCRAFPLALTDRSLTVAMADPLDYQALKDLEFSTGLQIRPLIATARDILEAVDRHYPLHASVKSAIPEMREEEISAVRDEARTLEERSRLAPIIRLADFIVARASRLRVSDIHIEPGPHDFRIRYRMDGLLKEDARLSRSFHGPLVSRIKILARLDIAERRMPQDGGFRVKMADHELDLRVSTMPTQHGEKVVIRILDPRQTALSLEGLGFLPEDLDRVRSLLSKKQGVLLLTGPTGSGKTTTLYAMIRSLQSETKNIVTVEDPIEYHLDGINQVQVNPEIGLTFAASLRSILRQDPNIILVGEIRDQETAEIAMRAAMTGHLVLSTLHTNNAPATITRLVDLGIPRYLIAASLAGVISQRLVRVICPRCKITVPSDDLNLKALFPSEPAGFPLFQGKGCPACHHLGYSGRIGLFEIMALTPDLREKTARGESELALRAAAHSGRMKSLGEDGLQKLKQGITSLEELLRVIEIESS